MAQRRKKLIWWIAGGFIVLVVFGNQGFRQLIGTVREKHRLENSLTTLRSDHERLSREVNWIQKDPSYSEYLIRKNLGYVKKGEVEYRFLKKGSRPPAPPPADAPDKHR